MKNKRTLYVTQGAIIAALYVALTELSALAGLSSSAIQFRISEALCILCAFTPAAIPALFIGCLIANTLTGSIPIDIVFGSLASLIGAALGYILRKYPFLVPLPTVLANVLIIPPVLKYAYGIEETIPYFMLTVGIGEIVCAYAGGVLLYYILRPYRNRLFPNFKQNKVKKDASYLLCKTEHVEQDPPSSEE